VTLFYFFEAGRRIVNVRLLGASHGPKDVALFLGKKVPYAAFVRNNDQVSVCFCERMKPKPKDETVVIPVTIPTSVTFQKYTRLNIAVVPVETLREDQARQMRNYRQGFLNAHQSLPGSPNQQPQSSARAWTAKAASL
jgi:hypothetical protein